MFGPKGAAALERLAVLLKRYPDTKREFFNEREYFNEPEYLTD
jgi:hypothetical protein